MRPFKRIEKWAVAVTAFALVGAFGPASGLAADVAMVPANFTQLAKKARPAVVNIRTVKNIKGGGRVFRHFFGNPYSDQNPFDDFFKPFLRNDPDREYKQRSLGSGFIIDKQGYIVTNNHVIDGADQIKVKLADDKEYNATVVGRDPNTDLALIKIPASKDLIPLPLGDSSKMAVGNWVLAIGSPFGLEQTVTAGIISAKGRIIGSGPYDDFIQTDASINAGNSGGPLINMDGQVIGINTAIIAQGQGIGFAIPINMAKSIITQLKEKGTVTRGWIGVGIQDLTDDLANYYGDKGKKGVLVTEVYKGDPADKAGIKTRDIILAVDGQSVSSARDLSRLIANTPVGKVTKITVLRNGEEKTLSVKLAKREDTALQTRQEQPADDNLGLSLVEMSAEAARRFGYDESEKGLLVADVAEDSPADSSGIQQGDLVKEVDHQAVQTVKEFQDQVARIKKGDTLQLLIRRGRVGFLVIRITR